MSETARGDDPKTIPQLVSSLEKAFEIGCGPFSPTVRHLQKVARRIDPDAGPAVAQGMIRARFGPAADPRPIPGSWPRHLLMLTVLLLLVIAVALGVLAWLAWLTGPKVDRVLSSLKTPARMEFTAVPQNVPAGTAVKTAPQVKVYDNLGGPVEGAEVEFTITQDPTLPAATGTFTVGNAPALAYVVPSWVASSLRAQVGSTVLDFGAGFTPTDAKYTGILVSDIGESHETQRTMADGQAALRNLLVGTKPGKFEITAEVKNMSNSLKQTIEVKVVAGPTLLKFAPDPPVATVGTKVGTLKVLGTKVDRFGNTADPLAQDAGVTVTVADDTGADVSDATLVSDDASVVADKQTASAKAGASGEADFGAMKFVSAKKRDYTLKATQVDGEGGAVGQPVSSTKFQVTGASP